MKNKLIGLDTNIFIYYLQQHPQFWKKATYIFTQMATNKKNGITSIITLTELLSLKQSEEEAIKLKKFYLEIPNLEIKEISRDIAMEAARIRRIYRFHLPDALQLATALASRADMLLQTMQN